MPVLGARRSHRPHRPLLSRSARSACACRFSSHGASDRATLRDTVSGWRWPPVCGESILRHV
eukprot:1057543-Prymnesium_polylepis.1